MNVPEPLQRLYALWMRFAHILGKIMSFILLSILWLVVFGIYAIILKIIRLFSRPSRADSYWHEVSQEESHLQYQF